ncbi:sensor domain-containing phosphodiesterase [Xanthomonas theicola]|uniref:Diguanylate phosphodiesterase n=1 Tax=Xanthomonas theicola TaxID=56464 RepID=A0A2S6ZB07_9XANT|nr:EAL domain-containing protein [Xanthomonas theicola]PPT81961.1 diguanylate phosphodiesterase [Xanthomonas theicola]QNH23831.1 EAL domain-containing protein [Xanthomonas theicola]
MSKEPDVSDWVQRPADATAERAPVASAMSEDALLLSRIILAQGEIAAAGSDPLQVVDVVTRRAQELTRSTGAVVEMCDGNDMLYWSASGIAEQHLGLRLPSQDSLSGLCMRSGQVLQCDDSEEDPRVNRAACRKVGLRSMLVVPLRYGDRGIGVLKVMSPYRCSYTAQDVRTLEMLATLVGATLALAMDRAALQTDIARRQNAEKHAFRERAAIATRIREAVANERLQIVTQPVLALATQRIVGVEALSRFPSNPGQPPLRWFEDASRVGLALELELAAARKALPLLAQLPAPLYLAINVSAQTLLHPQLEALLHGHDLSRVVLEITEQLQAPDYPRLSGHIGALQRQGLRIALDADIGFASLHHLLHLSPDIIKLDLTLTRGIDAEPRRQRLALAILSFAAETDANVIVEGIETESELATLQALGARYGQGYQLAHPGPLSAHLTRYPVIGDEPG